MALTSSSPGASQSFRPASSPNPMFHSEMNCARRRWGGGMVVEEVEACSFMYACFGGEQTWEFARTGGGRHLVRAATRKPLAVV
ncbi:hypothetical protein AB1Y20_022058 [Prymnesium parvum]|uniref:Uncharacterized protein n=1 Tax=Prymnesium parvum TaxID=97485 RepID=A0AB34JI90_PRYPA